MVTMPSFSREYAQEKISKLGDENIPSAPMTRRCPSPTRQQESSWPTQNRRVSGKTN